MMSLSEDPHTKEIENAVSSFLDQLLSQRECLSITSSSSSASSSPLSDIHRLRLLDIEACIARCWACESMEELESIKNHYSQMENRQSTAEQTQEGVEISVVTTTTSAPLVTPAPASVAALAPAPAAAAATPSMMLTKKSSALEDDIFELPHGQGFLTCEEIKRHYSDFASSMNGSDYGCCLLLYYEQSPVDQRYRLRDTDAAEDIAELMNINFHTVTTGEQ